MVVAAAAVEDDVVVALGIVGAQAMVEGISIACFTFSVCFVLFCFL